MSKIVVALGGNALGESPKEQLELVKGTAQSLVGLINKGYEVVISHGNGPQVGSINLGLIMQQNMNKARLSHSLNVAQ